MPSREEPVPFQERKDQERKEMRQEAPGPVQGEGPEAERMREEVLERTRRMIQESLGRLTPEMKNCVISRLGQSVYDKLQAGDFSGFTPQDSENIQRVTIECVQQFKPQVPPESTVPPEGTMPPESTVPPEIAPSPGENIAPPPPGETLPPPNETPPPPSSIISPQLLLGFIFGLLNLPSPR